MATDSSSDFTGTIFVLLRGRDTMPSCGSRSDIGSMCVYARSLYALRGMHPTLRGQSWHCFECCVIRFLHHSPSSLVAAQAEGDRVAMKLDCGHAFCRACVQERLGTFVRDSTNPCSSFVHCLSVVAKTAPCRFDCKTQPTPAAAATPKPAEPKPEHGSLIRRC